MNVLNSVLSISRPAIELTEIDRETLLTFAKGLELLAFTEQKIPLGVVRQSFVDGQHSANIEVEIPSLGRLDYRVRIEERGQDCMEAVAVIHTYPMPRVHLSVYDEATGLCRKELDFKSWSIIRHAIARISAQAVT